MTPYSDLPDSELAELVAFADGKLKIEEGRAAVARRVAASAELQTLVDEQRAVAACIRAAIGVLIRAARNTAVPLGSEREADPRERKGSLRR
jgi:hypothetical protein